MSKIFALFASLCRKLLYVWVKTRVIGASRQQLGIEGTGPVCYVLQSQSFANLLVVEEECRRAGLPRPYSKLEYGDQEGEEEKHSYFFLLPRSGGRALGTKTPKPSPTLVRVVEAVKRDPALDVQIIPVSIFWGRSPDKERSFLKIVLSDTWAVGGRLRKLFTILILGRNTFVQFSRPISLRQAVDEGHDQTETVRKLTRVLRLHFRNIRAGVIGPDLSHRRTLVNSLLTMPMVTRAIEIESNTKKIEATKALRNARKYADEIASDLSYTVIRLYDLVLTWLWNKLYNGVEINNLEAVKEYAGDHEVIYVPCHRSHIDYLLMSYVLFHHGLQMPHIAAGINLNMPVLGPILRRGGAFFMRRSFKDNQLYSAVFNEYLHTVFTRGYSVEYFVEGGRSRTGRTLQPRPGMLSMTVRSFLRDSKKPIVFVPAYFGYEKILEERTYLGELRGKKKKKESPLDVIRTLRNMRSSFGKVYVNFGTPIPLAEFLDAQQPDWRKQTYGEEYRPYWLAPVVDDLATLVVSRINEAVAVNPINLVAIALLSTPKQAMDESALVQQIDFYKKLQKRVVYSSTVTLPPEEARHHVAYVEDLQLINRMYHPMGDIMYLEGTNAVLMTYYRNNIIHLFAIPSLIAVMFRQNDELEQARVINACQTIYPYLKAELHLRWSEDEVEGATVQWIDALVAEGMLTREGDKLLSPSTSSQDFFMLMVLADTIRQTLERFYIVIVLLQKVGNGKATAEELENQCQLVAQRMSALHGFNAPEFFDKSLFRNFISMLRKMEVLEVNEDEMLVYNQPLDEAVADARLILSSEVRQSIRQITSLN